MSQTRASHRFQVRSALAVTAVLGSAIGLSLVGTSAAHATTGGSGLLGVFISEVNSHGPTTGANAGDWIELHNTTGAPVNLTGAILSDSGNSHKFVIGTNSSAASATIAAGGYQIYRTDDPANTGAANFGLGDQDEARLYAPGATVGTTPADEFDWNHSSVHTWAKDFTSNANPALATWEATTATTANAANVFTTPPNTGLADVRINEVNMNGGTHGDWIELINTGSSTATLTGAILSDNDNTHAYIIGTQSTDASVLPAGSITAIQVDNTDANGNFGLGGADSARLFSNTVTDLFGEPTNPGASAVGTVPATIDSETWASAPAFTLARIPDGTGAFTASTGPTFGTSNTGAGSGFPFVDLTGVVINEVKTTGDPSRGDWVELYNSGLSDVDLSNAILSDSNNAHIIRINSGVTIAAGDTLVISTDTDTDNPALVDPNATGNFGLGDNDSIRLFAADATDLATAAPFDSFSWTTHAPTSYGRQIGAVDPNTPGEWSQTSTPTPGIADNIIGGTVTPDLTWVQVNEISTTTNAGDPFSNDWVELVNTSTTTAIDVAGAVLSDSGDNHAIVLDSTNTEVGNLCNNVPTGNTPHSSMGTLIQPGEYALVKVDDTSITGNFGLGSDDAIRLYEPNGVPGTSIPIDHNEWTSHPTGSYQRQNNGLGDWVNGAINTQTPLAPNVAACH
jgi:hypothetical protein